MKSKAQHTVKKSTQILAYLMMLIFLSMPIIQLVHSHHQSPEIFSEIDGKPNINIAVEQCKLCDFFAHKQIKEFSLQHPIGIIIPVVQPIKLPTGLISGNYTFTLNGFTNKGPPVSALS